MILKLPSSKTELTIKESISGRERIILKRNMQSSIVFKNVQKDNKGQSSEPEMSFKDLTPEQAIEVEIQTMLVYIDAAKNEKGENINVDRKLIEKIIDEDAEDYEAISSAISEVDQKIADRKKK